MVQKISIYLKYKCFGNIMNIFTEFLLLILVHLINSLLNNFLKKTTLTPNLLLNDYTYSIENV